MNEFSSGEGYKKHQSDLPCEENFVPRGVESAVRGAPLVLGKGQGSTCELKVREMQISRDRS